MIKVENLKKTYDRRTRHANEVLHGMSFELEDTGFVCILGESGCGKTSLLNAIGGLDVFDSGKIITDNAEINRPSSPEMERERNASFGYIFQNYYLLSEHSVAYNVYIGMHSMALTKKEKMSRVRDALERVDMLRYRKRLVGELSGGQQQRVAIARAIARRPRVIFADEPTGNLDEANTMNICSILKELSNESLVVMVTHEERIARFFADRIITLDAGRVVSDTTEWTRTTMDACTKDTLYTGDYTDKKICGDELSVRLLQAPNAAPVNLTVVAEADRIVIKVDDSRIVLCSETSAVPHIQEGKRPVLEAADFKKEVLHNTQPKPQEQRKSSKKGLGFAMLINEARSLVSGKKLRKFGTGVFIVLLSFMLAVSIADIVTVAHIDPEDFITTDSHMLGFKFGRASGLTDKYVSIAPYVAKYREHLDKSLLDFDYIATTSNVLKYTDSTFPQFEDISITFNGSSWVNICRLDEAALIKGRMPTASNEIVIDRWLIDKILAEEGILQNIIPDAEYLLNKELTCDKKTYTLTIVGISDSGEPSIYMSTEAMLAYGTNGVEVITLSEYKTLTGDERIETLGKNECVVITDNAGKIYEDTFNISSLVRCNYPFELAEILSGVDDSIGAKLIISDDALKPLYRCMIEANNDFSIWCADKSAMYEYLDKELPQDLLYKLDIAVNDTYGRAYKEYEERTMNKLDARTIVTATVLITSVIMLYLMQRSKIRERMDLVAVYRLLGIPKKNLLFIFSAESIFLTLKYALPTVATVWIVLNVSSAVEWMNVFGMIYPLWAAGLTLLAIAVIRLALATLPVLRLLRMPPAKLAAKYDF